MLTTPFLLTSLVVALIPGTGAIYTISAGLFRGRVASLWAALGCTLGIVPHLLASALGLSLILHQSALLFQGLSRGQRTCCTLPGPPGTSAAA